MKATAKWESYTANGEVVSEGWYVEIFDDDSEGYDKLIAHSQQAGFSPDVDQFGEDDSAALIAALHDEIR